MFVRRESDGHWLVEKWKSLDDGKWRRRRLMRIDFFESADDAKAGWKREREKCRRQLKKLNIDPYRISRAMRADIRRIEYRIAYLEDKLDELAELLKSQKQRSA